MNRPEDREPAGGRKELQDTDSERGDMFAIPLGSITHGRLELVRGATNVAIHTDDTMAMLFRAQFEGPEPRVRVEGGVVTIERPHALSPFEWRKRTAEVTLNGSISWGIQIKGGASRLKADLSRLRLSYFEVAGGASRLKLRLPKPFGVVHLLVGGGASNVTIRRPAGVPVRVRVGSGATDLSLDEQHLGAIGGEARLESPDYTISEDRYQIEIRGGANKLTVGML